MAPTLIPSYIYLALVVMVVHIIKMLFIHHQIKKK